MVALLPPSSQVKMAYVNFVNHCYVDTEVEMKEIYTSNHIWTLFENFTLDMARVRGERWVGGTQWLLYWMDEERLMFLGHGHHGDLCSWHMKGWGAVRALWYGPRSCVISHIHQQGPSSAVCPQHPARTLCSRWCHHRPPFSQMCKKREKRLPDPTLEKYVLTVVLDTINAFFSSPFSENSTSLQVIRFCMGRTWLWEESSSLSPMKEGLDTHCTDRYLPALFFRPTRPLWCSFSSPP